MDNCHTILFDLDGTLSDPKVGIIAAMRYAMMKMKRPLSSDADLDWCIGPPLQDNFAKLLQTDDPALIEQGVVAFREYFATTGLFENELYDGIPELLTTLSARGLRCYVATSKPTIYAEQIIAHFGLVHAGGSSPTFNTSRRLSLSKAKAARGRYDFDRLGLRYNYRRT